MEYVTLYGEERFGLSYGFGIKIEVAATKIPDLKQEKIQYATYEAARLISSEILAAIKADDPNSPHETKQNQELISLFPEPIFVEEIPNGYCRDWCCRHLPWFIVTTKVGRFKIGWRKRVISIDWSETRGTATSDLLFDKEDVTKGDKSIHAWSMDDAHRYILDIINNVTEES